MNTEVTEAIEIQTEFKIPAYNLPYLEKRLAKLNKRAAKLDCPQITVKQVGTEEVEVQEGVTLTYLYIEVHGETPRIAGWSFVGTIDHAGQGNILRTVPGQSLPEDFRTVTVKCEHCQKSRIRKNTYVVLNEDGEYKQVGRQCLRDFLGHQSPERIARFAEFLMNIEEELVGDEDDIHDNTPRGEYHYDLAYYLAYVAQAIEDKGWLSKTKAIELDRYPEATATVAMTNMTFKPTTKQKSPPPPTTEHLKQAREAIEWCREELANRPNPNDYTYNLITACAVNAIPSKNTGIAASLIPTWQGIIQKQKVREEEHKLEAKVSNYVGEVGKRNTFKVQVLKVVSLDGNYGPTHIHRMADEDGNIFVWFAHTTPLEQSLWYELTGTIKKHSIYNGVKQTVLTRCKVKERIEEGIYATADRPLQ